VSESTTEKTSASPVAKNPTLVALYGWGISLIAGGLVIAGLSFIVLMGPVPWLGIGLGLFGVGVLPLVGAAVAEAINWQIAESLTSRADGPKLD
jgi:hypothetical protein